MNSSCALTAETAPTHDKVNAAEFLKTLDPTAQRFTFQFLSDGDDSYAEVSHGTVDEVWRKVLVLNTTERRVGVFVTINETDFGGRRTENIIRARALFVDADGEDQVQRCREAIRSADVEPTILVRSSARRLHIYWCCDDLPREQFSALQGAIIDKLGTDPTVRDLPRVMRLPGTLHLKNAPIKVTQLIPGQRWKLADLSARLALSDAQSRDGLKLDETLFTHAIAERLRLLLGQQRVENELGAGIDVYNSPPVNLNDVAAECPFVREAIATGGAAYSQPLWMMTTLLATFTDGGRADAHWRTSTPATPKSRQTSCSTVKSAKRRKRVSGGRPAGRSAASAARRAKRARTSPLVSRRFTSRYLRR
jgi:hypothetical protein